MARLIVTAQVEDVERWEAGFLSHVELFREMGITATHFTTTEDNWVALYEEVEDVGKYFEIMESPAVGEAMASDGVKVDTVKVFVLDKEVPGLG